MNKVSSMNGRIALVASTICAAAVCAAKPAAERMDRSKLLIGAYCLQENAKTEAHVKAIRDCGVDFIIGLPADDRATLDLFEKHGVGAIVNKVVPGWWGGDGERAGKMREVNPPEKYAAGAAAFKDHPAIWAIDIGDEPSALDFPYYGDVVRQLNKALPGMPLYLNLYPNYASVSQNSGRQTVNQLGTPTYAEHIGVYCREVPLDYLSYDFYPYLAKEKATDRFLSKMYDNFLDVSEACRRTKRSFWYIPQVNSRFGLPPTSENRLRFQANAALSFGAEAVTWACWCKGWWTNNVLDAAGNQTVQYEKLKRVNAELKNIGPRYMRFRNVATHFVGFPEKSPQNPARGFPRVEKLDFGPFKGLRASNGARLLVGEMAARDPSSSGSALFVTAADDPADAHPAKFEIVFRCSGVNVKAFGGAGEIPVARRADGSFAVSVASCQGVLLEGSPVPDASAFNAGWTVKGKRVVNINTVVRVNQIEVSRDCNRGKDEAHLHTVEAVETFRKAVSDAIPEAKVTWAFSWRALQDPRPNYVAIRKRVTEYHRQYGDEITFIPGAYFAPMYNSRAQTNRDIHDGLKLVSEMVGGGYRPHGIVAGFLAADNLRFLAEEEKIHVAQGTIWSQYGIDNGDGDGSVSYPYYPSREHACKPAQGKADFIDCVNLDGWTCDFLCARQFGFESGGNSRTGVGPIETYGRLGIQNGLKETRAVVRSHFRDNFKRNGFGWIVVNWEICLVKHYPPEITAALTTWLKGIREEFPDAIVPLMSEFGEAWRRENPDNAKLDYRFVERGTGLPRILSEPNLEIRWYMNRSFRLATLRDWTKNEPEKVIDFTRYDLPAKEPPDASVEKPSRNWSLVNRINQKRRRPQDAPVPLSALTEEERRLVAGYVQPLEK